MNKDTSFWKNKKCIVTGGIGFIGSHLCKQLYDLHACVIVMDKESCHDGTLFHHLNKNSNITTIQCDLANPNVVNLIQEIQPDVIFHLAALPYAPYTTLHPLEAYASNVVSTVNVLEGARLSSAKKFFLASSACVFGASQHSPLHANDAPYPPEHYYSITKQDAERQVRAFHNWYGINATICRFGNVYGPGDRHFGRIIPQVCHQLINEKQEILQLKRSRGDSIFEFLYVEDAVKAFIGAAERNSAEIETWHFSGGEEARTTIINLAERVSELFDGKKREVKFNVSSPERKVEKYLDVTDTVRLLDWKVDWHLETGLKTTIGWYANNINFISPYQELVEKCASALTL